MNFQQNVSLLQYNTFHIQAKAAHYCEFKNVEDLREALKWMNEKKIHDPLVLGGGSNILLTRDVEFVMANRISGFEVCQETNEDVIVKAGAGLNWHQFVLECIQKGYGGIENLSLIPGNVGASPMQNIGAYGVEIKDVFHELEAVEISSGDIIRMNNQECEFGYRESVFKNKYRNRFVITSVSYKLSKVPVVNTSYGAIEEELGKMEISSPGIKDVSNAVINIRQSKLPDPSVTGNAGSFFKNPEIDLANFEKLKNLYPGMPGYKMNDKVVKIPAAWLIEQCGWKGYRRGDAGCHARQPLVLVNFGNATGREILDLSSEIMKSVNDKFGIALHREVNIV